MLHVDMETNADIPETKEHQFLAYAYQRSVIVIGTNAAPRQWIRSEQLRYTAGTVDDLDQIPIRFTNNRIWTDRVYIA